MDPQDPLLLRWLSQVHSDAPLELGGNAGGPPEGLTAEQEAVWRRLQLVEGLLGTLDHRTAPRELDARVEAVCNQSEPEALNPEPIDAESQAWVLPEFPSNSVSKQDAPAEAPEFLDRLVREKFEVMAAELARTRNESKAATVAPRRRVARPLSRISLVATGVLLMALVPWGMLAKHQGSASIELTQYNSLDGLRAAHPDAADFARQTGEFGVFFGARPATALSPGSSRGEAPAGLEQGGAK